MKNIAVLFLLLISGSAGAIELSNGILTDGELIGISDAQRASLIKISEVLEAEGIDINAAIATTNSNSSQIWYSLLDDIKLYAVNVADEKYLGGWELKPYPDHLMLGGEYSAGAEAIATAYGEDFSRPETLQIVTDREPSYSLSPEKMKQTLGCLENYPLRYGDINNNTKNELVLMLGKNIVVFSPESKQVIFGAHYYMSDELSPKEAENWGISNISPNDPAHVAYSTVDAKDQLYPAWRSLSKLYFGNFDDDSAHDILLWRKLYESRLVSDSVKGFTKKGELLVHYKLIDGEYKLQPTESDKVKSWLSANELTWQKGYPSKSECSGEEGEFIPEMHDPLLNDPEVLQ